MRVESGKLAGQDKIGLAVGEVLNQFKMAKPFDLLIACAQFPDLN